MKIQIVTAKTREALEQALGALVAGDITVHSLAYAIGPKGEREAIVLYSDGGTVHIPAAVRDWLGQQLAS